LSYFPERAAVRRAAAMAETVGPPADRVPSDDPEGEVGTLYRAMSRSLIGFAMPYVGGDRPEAEGLVQEAFVEAWRQWTTVRKLDERRRRAWLCQVIRHKAISSYRKKNNLVAVDPQCETLLNLPAASPDVTQLVLARDLLDQCTKVIHNLREDLQLAIALRCEGFRSSQIASLMGRSPSTVRGYWAEVIDEITRHIGPVIEILDESDEGDRP
jgi:RNA polymerase sigma factor (sigma-70 family)